MQADGFIAGSGQAAGAPTPRAALLWLFVVTALTGAAMVALKGRAGMLVAPLANFALSFLPFLWYCRDGNARNFRRTI